MCKATAGRYWRVSTSEPITNSEAPVEPESDNGVVPKNDQEDKSDIEKHSDADFAR
jgi:hypothetical protein